MDGQNEKFNFWRQSWPNFIQNSIYIFILGIIILLVTIFFIEYFFYRFQNSFNAYITYTPEGAMMFSLKKNEFNVIYSLHSSQFWSNTGIDIPPGWIVEFQASGCVQLAIHSLVDCAKKDKVLLSKWIGPEGIPKNIPDQKDLLIYPDAPLGCLLGYLCIPGKPEPCLNKPRPEKMFIIGDNLIYKNKCKSTCKLWLIVNDLLIENSKEVNKERYFTAPDLEGVSKEEKQKMWDNIVQYKYWNLWYDDNVGSYLVQIKIKAP